MTLIALRPSQKMIDIVGVLGGEWHGYKAMCKCPAHPDKTASLSIRQGDRGILLTCFAGCTASDILREINRFPIDRRYAPPPIERPAGTANIERLWSQAGPIEGTLGERYLASRFLLPAPSDVRFHPRCPHGPKPRTEFKPALLVPIREAQRLVGVQRIFLDPKTAKYTEKATLGTLGSGVWRGGGIGPTIALAEGFETARAWSKIHSLPCWASLGSRRLDLATIPSSVSELILVGDNDLAGRLAVARSIERYTSDDRVIRVHFPRGANDWAEALETMERGGGVRM